MKFARVALRGGRWLRARHIAGAVLAGRWGRAQEGFLEVVWGYCGELDWQGSRVIPEVWAQATNP